jgi:uncharacterized protein (DUF488 family)
MPEERTVYTIGYEGRSPADFDAALVEAGVTTLVDVRRRAMSRKPGFAKTALRTRLAESGIGYVHLPDLGVPLEVFHLRKQRNHGPLLAAYDQYLPEAAEAVDHVLTIIANETACLMCFEEEVDRCHRSVLTRHLQQQESLHVVNL